MSTSQRRIRASREHDPQTPPVVDGRPPPHDPGAEQAVLSAMILQPDHLDEVPWLRAEHFFSESHRRVMEAIFDLRRENLAIDTVQVATWLRDRGRLDQVGGVPYLASILSAAPVLAPANVIAHARTVHNKWRVRQMILIFQTYGSKGYLDYGDTDDFLAAAEQAVMEAAKREDEERTDRLSVIVQRVYEETAKAQELNIAPGLPTGFRDYDAATCGKHPGELTIVAARPGMGKTGYALSMALNVARTPPELFGEKAALCGVAIFSLEMPKEQLTQRAMAVESGVDGMAIRRRYLSRQQWDQLAAGCSRLSALPIEIDDTPALELAALRAKVRRIRSNMRRGAYGGAHVELSLIIVDYLQLMTNNEPSLKSREEKVGGVARGLKELAKVERLPVIALAQLNRDVEKRKGNDRRPGLADLRESGELEQACDEALFLYRPEHYGDPVQPGQEGMTELIIGKQRSGPTTTVFARYHKQTTAFTNM